MSDLSKIYQFATQPGCQDRIDAVVGYIKALINHALETELCFRSHVITRWDVGAQKEIEYPYFRMTLPYISEIDRWFDLIRDYYLEQGFQTVVVGLTGDNIVIQLFTVEPPLDIIYGSFPTWISRKTEWAECRERKEKENERDQT